MIRRLYQWQRPQTRRESWMWRTGVAFGIWQGWRLCDAYTRWRAMHEEYP